MKVSDSGYSLCVGRTLDLIVLNRIVRPCFKKTTLLSLCAHVQNKDITSWVVNAEYNAKATDSKASHVCCTVPFKL